MVSSLLKQARQERRAVLWTVGVWTTRTGEEIHISRLSDTHLKNIYNLLNRWAWRKYALTRASLYAYPEPRGEGAQDAFWQAVDEFDDMLPFDILREHPFYIPMMQEIVRRFY